MSGPLTGVKVLEIAGIGPGPFCGMLLADMGADVLRVDRLQASDLGLPMEPKFEITSRGRRSIALDLKRPESIQTVLALAARADALFEGFRPGVTERLGLGPDACLARNPRLVYGRITGWGQDGPLAQAAGHDINYIALSGALHAIGRKGEAPVPPLNLVGDYGGGGMYLAFGIACALYEARASGKGQVIDAAMSDGAASLMGIFYGRMAAGIWRDQRGVNVLDTGAPWYNVYETADGKHVAIGSIEGRFYAELLERLSLDPKTLPGQHERERWPELCAAFSAAFKSKTRDEWCRKMEGTDVCFAPVLSLAEAPRHAHNRARGAFVDINGVTQPAPAPRYSRTPGAVARGAPRRGEGGAQALADWGFDKAEIEGFRARGALLDAA
ncbi:MAG: CoA transferase [Betaproteobacteria bacterium]|nr:MAG: CoA transferase [Betaproteobacteria bacterium]